jgi:uncharacterized protein (DUF302 family)
MYLKTSLILIVLSVLTPFTQADGLIKKPSTHSVETTIQRLKETLEKKGIRVFAHIDHQKNAEGVKLELGEVQLLIFGNPRLGTPLMQSNPEVGIDLPMKALVWEDSESQVWLAYNDPRYLVTRHDITDRQEVVKKMSTALDKLTNAAISP